MATLDIYNFGNAFYSIKEIKSACKKNKNSARIFLTFLCENDKALHSGVRRIVVVEQFLGHWVDK